MNRKADFSRYRCHLEIRTPEGKFLDERSVRLLESIQRTGSISRAARLVPYSYKAAWDAIQRMNQAAKSPLVTRSAGGRNGGGTRLTEYGQWVITLYRALEGQCQGTLEDLLMVHRRNQTLHAPRKGKAGKTAPSPTK